MTTQDIETVVQKTFRLSPKAQILLVKLARYYGLDQKGVLEVLIRQVAEKENITVD